jgi:hypothetical protein
LSGRSSEHTDADARIIEKALLPELCAALFIR